MFLCLAIISIAKAALIQTASVSVSNYYIRQTTTVLLSLTMPSSIPANGKLEIVFPQDLKIGSQVLCSLDQGVASPSAAICSSNNQSVTITKCFPTTSNMILSLYGIPTPNFALTTESFAVYSLSENGLVIDSVADGLNVEFFPLLMSDAEVFVNNEQVWTLSVSTKYEIPMLVLQLPVRDGYLDPPTGYSSLYCQNVTCSNISSKP